MPLCYGYTHHTHTHRITHHLGLPCLAPHSTDCRLVCTATFSVASSCITQFPTLPHRLWFRRVSVAPFPAGPVPFTGATSARFGSLPGCALPAEHGTATPPRPCLRLWMLEHTPHTHTAPYWAVYPCLPSHSLRSLFMFLNVRGSSVCWYEHGLRITFPTHGLPAPLPTVRLPHTRITHHTPS